jgi:hypothetical protein
MKVKSLTFLHNFGYMLEPNREIWQYFHQKNVEIWPLENQSNTYFESLNLARKKRLHNREIWQYFQKTKLKMWSLENPKKKNLNNFFSHL